MNPEKIHFLSKHGIQVYPISEIEFCRRRSMNTESKQWLIEVNNNNKIKTFPKKIPYSEVDEAIWKTINYYYELLKEKK